LFRCGEREEAVFFSLSFHFVGEKMDVGEKKRALAGTGKRLFILFCFL